MMSEPGRTGDLAAPIGCGDPRESARHRRLLFDSVLRRFPAESPAALLRADAGLRLTGRGKGEERHASDGMRSLRRAGSAGTARGTGPAAARAGPRHVVTIGACATSGGVQALRNFADVREYASIVYANPDYISTLDQSTPIAAHVPVDFELRGCPIDKRQLLEVIGAFLAGRRPEVPAHPTATERASISFNYRWFQ